MHTGKQHGLNDCVDYILDNNFSLVLCPDAGSNDYEAHTTLQIEHNIPVIILDHHLADFTSQDAIIINNQLSDYPNKYLSGVGVVWQFCRFFDSLLKVNYANDFLDLVALGLDADMMSLKSYETRYLITKGFLKENIKNPFIDYMLDKNAFPLSKSDYVSTSSAASCTAMGAAFFIVPFINAITRSGTQEEKEILFKAMLQPFAFQEVLSNKRGHKLGDTEKLILQAVRTVTNVKNRQTRAEEAGLEMLERMIENNHMLDHKILLFLLEPNQIPAEIRGLIANKFMAKYQRPCCILTRTIRDGIETYEGSMRGYTKTGIDSFKHILSECPEVLYVQGHDNAAGLGLAVQDINKFLQTIDKKLENITDEPIYRVDYNFDQINLLQNAQRIIDIAQMNDYWGQDIDRAYVHFRFKITKNAIHLMKSNTLKIDVGNNVSLIKFNASENEIESFNSSYYMIIDGIGKCNANTWGNETYPQLILEDYTIITDTHKFNFYDF